MRIKQFLQVAFLVMLAGGVAPAYSSLWQWSHTASSNGGADPTINFAEGQSPSSLNDSARALMARVADYRDDISGLLTTAGTATAYTVTTSQGLCLSPSVTPQDGQLLSITPNATNGAAVTLAADSCSAFPIQTSPGAAVGAGTLISGSPYTMKFSVANSAWMLRDFYSSAFNVPLGALVAYTGSVSPNSNFILPAGQCISTTTYAAYWVLMGSPASGTCPGGQFATLDMRGRVPAALDNLNGTAANRLTNSGTGCGTAMTAVGSVCTNGLEGYALTLAQMPTHTHNNSISDPGHVHTSYGNTNNLSAQGPYANVGAGNNQTNPLNTGLSFTGIQLTNASAGGGAVHPTIQPTIGVTYLLRVI